MHLLLNVMLSSCGTHLPSLPALHCCLQREPARKMSNINTKGLHLFGIGGQCYICSSHSSSHDLTLGPMVPSQIKGLGNNTYLSLKSLSGKFPS